MKKIINPASHGLVKSQPLQNSGEIFSWVNPWPSENPVVMLQVCLENHETNNKTN